MFASWMDKVPLKGEKMADRYKEGYNDCNREWRNKIKDELKELDKKKRKSRSQFKYSTIDEFIFDNKIEALQDLLKKG